MFINSVGDLRTEAGELARYRHCIKVRIKDIRDSYPPQECDESDILCDQIARLVSLKPRQSVRQVPVCSVRFCFDFKIPETRAIIFILTTCFLLA